jgi:ABC-type cobalamin/Fe3+-siderophores transport system ATPase subunit
MSRSETFLEARALALGYGPTSFLQVPDLVLEGEFGHVVGLAGMNGAGKSTFLKACLGLHAPSAGSLRLRGVKAGTRSFRRLLNRVGYVPQARPAGAFRLTVREVVECGRYGRVGFLGWRGRDDRRAVDAAMEEAGVAGLAGRAIQELSGGQYQRVQIARALASEPEIVFLDEPSSHLDTEGRTGVIEVISAIARERRAFMFLASHDEELLGLADTLLVFAGGRMELRDA